MSRLSFTLSHKSAPSRYLVHAISARHGERYLGVVWPTDRHKNSWQNNHDQKTYNTRQAAAEALRK